MPIMNKITRKYSKRLGTLSYAQFQIALDRFNLGELVEAKPIPFGNFGQNVFLTSTKGEYVLRGAPHYPWQFPKEQFFARLLHEYTPTPVPWPYLLDSTDDVFGWSCAIMPRMPGLLLIDPDVRETLGIEDKLALARAMGETLADMHTLTWPHVGEYDLEIDTIRPLDVEYGEWIISRIRHNVQRAIPFSERTTDADVEWVEGVISKGRAALDVPFQPCCVMQDYKEGNAVAECVAGVWRISGVCDLMELYFGDGEADLSRSAAFYANENPELARAFVCAYVSHRSLRPGFAERFPVYMLLDRTIIWQFAQRHGVWWDERLTLREWAGQYTSLELF